MKRFLTLLALFVLAGCYVPAQAQSNSAVNLLASGPQTASTVVTANDKNFAHLCAHIVIDVTAYTSGTYTPTVQGYDGLANVYYTILTGAAINAAGVTVLKVCPGITPVANVAVADMLPAIWRVSFAGASTPSMTFSVDALKDF